jgi:very-short-patch-repair endonuclease
VIDQARTRIERWKSSLIEGQKDGAGEDLLLDVRDGQRCLPLPGVDPIALSSVLSTGGAFTFEAGMDPGVETGWLRIPLPTVDLERRLTLLRRAARRARTSRGEHVLWIALGALVWESGGVERTSPLALWPAELERTASGSARLVTAEGVEPRINSALVGTLEREVAVLLAAPMIGSAIDIAGLFGAADGLAVTRPSWRVERIAKLGVFSFARFSLAADLAGARDTFTSHALVAQLANIESDARAPFAQPSIAAADAVTRPAGGAVPASLDVVAPLDADAYQLAAIHAAAEGATFVLQAPPGTGSTQTIANLIVHASTQGKSVLVVGEAPAGLDAILQRLGSVGLAELCLPLYGAGATRGRIVAQLARVVERTFRPGVGGSGGMETRDSRLVELRLALDGHVAALHAVGPFGRSLHDVLGRLVELRTAPNADLAEQDAVGLDRATFQTRLAAVTALATAAVPVEPVATHAWRLSTLESAPPGLRENAIVALEEAANAADVLAGGVRELSHLVPNLVAKTREQLSALGALAMVAAVSPRPGAELLTNMRSGKGEDIDERVALIRARGGGTVEVPRDPLAFLALAHKHRALVNEVEDHFTHTVESLDAGTLWAQLRKWTHSMAPLRFVALRTARAEVKAAAMPTHLETDEAMISALEAVLAERACRSALLAAAEPAKRWFGNVGGDPLTLDLAKLDDAVSWSAELRRAFDALDVIGGAAGRESAWRALVAQVAANPGTNKPAGAETSAVSAGLAIDAPIFAKIAEAVARWSPALAALGDATGIPAATLAAGDDHLVALRERVDVLRHAVDALPAWVAFHSARCAGRAAGIGPAIGAIERGDLGASDLATAWERATLLAWADAELADRPALSHFHGATHHAQVTAFADLDRGALALARARALAKLAALTPRLSQDPTGELALLAGEAKSPERSLRALLAALPTVRARIAPCILATPSSVAELLEPAASFDLVVICDADQLTTPVAIGAITRGAATMIVGDRARQIEGSLLADCAAATLPELSLGWHYRSKHEDLVSLANERAYAGRLQVLPVAHATSELGVAWRGVAATFDGDALVNRAEAEAIVADVLSRLRDPAQRARSIGVVVMTDEQRALIEDLLDEARADDPTLEALLEPAELGPDAAVEPVVIDTIGAFACPRDVILLAATFAPTERGDLAIEYGPLVAPGGDRALLAASTRAREQLVVFSSIASEEVPVDARAGVCELAALLAFVQKGGSLVRRVEDAPPASAITEAIGRALVERGWIIRHQVGIGPFKLDLAVVDPNDPDRFVLAIEHDGAAYATSRVARDRDRLRPQTLAQLGWRLHRIWGLDWWADAEREIQRAHGAIVTAIAATRQRRAPVVTKPPRLSRASAAPATAQGSAPVVRIPPKAASSEPPVLASGSGPTLATPLAAYDGPTTPTKIARNAIPIGPYTAAAIPAGRRTPDDLFAPRYLGEVQKIVEQVLAAEAPMHVDLLARRVGGYFGIGRLSQRVNDQIVLALDGRGKFGDEDKIVWRLDQDPTSVPPVRVAGQHATARRAIEEVPLSELASAARIVVERAGGITTPELVRDSARLLGFARVTEQVSERVTLGVRLAIARELIRISDNKALLPRD